MHKENSLTARVLKWLEDNKAGGTIGDLADSLMAPRGDVRGALYELLDAKRVRFSDGRWRSFSW